jgi:hypothetical protein
MLINLNFDSLDFFYFYFCRVKDSYILKYPTNNGLGETSLELLHAAKNQYTIILKTWWRRVCWKNIHERITSIKRCPSSRQLHSNLYLVCWWFPSSSSQKVKWFTGDKWNLSIEKHRIYSSSFLAPAHPPSAVFVGFASHHLLTASQHSWCARWLMVCKKKK